jgi:hypothetical protein
MMRLVFLFSAEERGLFPLDDELYNQDSAASTLREQLREAADQQGEEVIERRLDAWSRLLTTFRAIHAGIEHDRLRLPAYGGSLFDPDKFEFLEGRPRGSSWLDMPADPLPINNRTVLHLLEALQLLQVRVPGGGPAEARRFPPSTSANHPRCRACSTTPPAITSRAWPARGARRRLRWQSWSFLVEHARPRPKRRTKTCDLPSVKKNFASSRSKQATQRPRKPH